MKRLLTPLTVERQGSLASRQWGAPSSEPFSKSYRTPQQRDRDRVLYCSALQRLAYITQVTAPESGHTFHNRLSHSLKVAQVGRRNAERLEALAREKHVVGAAAALIDAIDADAVEASCLAHDLGHPPFGHIAEQVLNREANSHVPDGFEGNAQSFRIVTRLAVREPKPGLDLTRQTLDGLLKYPWLREEPDSLDGKREQKWGSYADDREAFEFARLGWPSEDGNALPERCLAAEIMDWADDLTYAVHDVDDFFRAGLIPLDRLGEAAGTETKHLIELLDDARTADPAAFPNYEPDELAEAARQVISLLGLDEPYRHTASARAAMREFGSRLITSYLDAFSLSDDPVSGKVRLEIDDVAQREVEALKMLVVAYVVRRPSLAVVQQGQMRVIGELFEWYFEASSPDVKIGNRHLFPPGVKERLDKGGDTADERARVVLDLISGLTESSALQLHNRISGGWKGSALDATAVIG